MLFLLGTKIDFGCLFSRNPFQNVNRWFTTIINQPEVKSVIGNFKLCEKMAEFDAKKFADVQGKD